MTGNYAALYRHVSLDTENDVPDESLLARFAGDRDERAFAELVRRHGPTVFGVCRRTVGHHQDAEDAFQATFLVLARKAGKIGQPKLLGNWLYGVAVRVAAKARLRSARERTGVDMPETPTRPAVVTNDVLAEIDTELARLPAHYRDAVLLCDVQGVSRPDAAARLGVPDGTLSSRLANGRKKLAARLTKKGIALPAVGTLLVSLPDAMAGQTVERVLGWSAGATVPVSILELTRIGGSAMRYSIGALVLTSIGLAAGAAVAWPQAKQPDPQPPPPAAVAAEAPKPDQADQMLTVQPRRLKTVALTFEAQGMVWSSDGRYLAVTGPNSCVVIDTKTFSSAGMTEAGHRVVGFLPGSPTLVSRVWDRGKINGLNQLTFWTVTKITPQEFRGIVQKDQFWLVVDRRLEIDDEQAEWVQIQPDGKTILTLHVEPSVLTDGEPKPALETRSYLVRLLDVTTGNPVREFPLGDLHLKAFGSSSDGTKLFVTSASRKGYLMQCRSLPDGKEIWKSGWESSDEKPVSAGEVNHPFQTVAFGAKGTKMAVVLGNHIIKNPNLPKSRSEVYGSEIQIIDPATGKFADTQINYSTNKGMIPGGFSPDGRLFAVTMNSRNSKLVQIWDLTTGKVVKQWSGNATTLFAPDRPVLAILETSQDPDETDQSVKKSTIGFWDCAAAVK